VRAERRSNEGWRAKLPAALQRPLAWQAPVAGRAVAGAGKAAAIDWPRVLLEVCRRIERAAEAHRALAADPDDVQILLDRGDAYTRDADYDNAISDFTQTLQRVPTANHRLLADVFHRRGVAYARKRRYEEAIADYTRAIQQNPNDAAISHDRAAAHRKKGAAAAAAADDKTAGELEDNEP